MEYTTKMAILKQAIFFGFIPDNMIFASLNSIPPNMYMNEL